MYSRIRARISEYTSEIDPSRTGKGIYTYIRTRCARVDARVHTCVFTCDESEKAVESVATRRVLVTLELALSFSGN